MQTLKHNDALILIPDDRDDEILLSKLRSKEFDASIVMGNDLCELKKRNDSEDIKLLIQQIEQKDATIVRAL